MNQWVPQSEIDQITREFAEHSAASGQMASVFQLQKDAYIEKTGEAHERAFAVSQEQLTGVPLSDWSFDPVAQLVHKPQVQLQQMSFLRGDRDVSLGQSRVATSIGRARYDGFTQTLEHPAGGSADLARWRHVPAHPTERDFAEAQRIQKLTQGMVSSHLGVEQYHSHAPGVTFRHQEAKH